VVRRRSAEALRPRRSEHSSASAIGAAVINVDTAAAGGIAPVSAIERSDAADSESDGDSLMGDSMVRVLTYSSSKPSDAEALACFERFLT
jgi:hypothetical protein